MAKILGYDFEVMYESRCENRVVHEESVHAISMPIWVDSNSLQVDVRKDPFLGDIILSLEAGSKKYHHYTLVLSVLLYKNRLIFPASSMWTQTLMQEYHVTPQGGHSRVFHTY